MNTEPTPEAAGAGDVNHKSQPLKTVNVYVILDDQSNLSLVRSELLDVFRVEGSPTNYTLTTCAGTNEVNARQAEGFSVRGVAQEISLELPPLLECNEIPDNRNKIPTFQAAECYPHLRHIAGYIPLVDPRAQTWLLLGRDVIAAHKVLQTRSGPRNSPFAHKHDLGWVIVGNICITRARRPSTARTTLPRFSYVIIINKYNISTDTPRKEQ
ncbi:hypothetical protein MRX96_054525 [Rhipicephalus microplus]